jgi:uncharacterized protein YqjF (DUF2071 family)
MDDAVRLLARSPNGRRPLVMRQRWENLLFLHWRIEPERVQETLPPGLTVDTFRGDAYLGITPFFMRNVRLRWVPAIPWFSNFQELNVRTYAYDRDGTPGVWFYSLDCNRAWASFGARLLGALPYFRAEMRSRRSDWLEYSCRRRATQSIAHYRYRQVGVNRAIPTESLEFFLLERYYLFAFRANTGVLRRAQVAHAPYQIRDVDVAEFSAIPAQLDGFSEITRAPDHMCIVDGFDVNVFAPERVEGLSWSG